MTKLSIIICTYNRDRYLGDVLNSLTSQTADNSVFEVIVIDNNSKDNTANICKSFAKENPLVDFKYEFEGKQGLSSARNKGIIVSNSDLIVYIDDDAIAEDDFVENLVLEFENHPDFDAMGGKVLPIYPDGKEPRWMSSYIQRLVSKVDDGDKTMEFKKKYPVGCNMAFRKEIFKNIGGFNEDLTLRSDDKFIFQKVRNAGLKTLYVPNVVVHHNIEAFRLEYDFIKNLSKLNGQTDRIRLRSEKPIFSLLKLIDYLFKLAASFILALGFMLEGKPLKAKYIIVVMANTLYGFVNYKN